MSSCTLRQHLRHVAGGHGGQVLDLMAAARAGGHHNIAKRLVLKGVSPEWPLDKA